MVTPSCMSQEQQRQEQEHSNCCWTGPHCATHLCRHPDVCLVEFFQYVAQTSTLRRLSAPHTAHDATTEVVLETREDGAGVLSSYTSQGAVASEVSEEDMQFYEHLTQHITRELEQQLAARRGQGMHDHSLISMRHVMYVCAVCDMHVC